jgi:NRAMP (natural resistance-associated macrophage protein)-like metal ion transporter
MKFLKNLWKILGPGLITGASDDDPSGIATYSQAGAQYGLSTLWMAFFTFPLMASIQEMCARIGMVTSLGLTGALKKNYPKPILYLMVLFSFPAIILNIGADIAGMGAVTNLIFPTIPAFFFSIFFTVIMLFLIIYLPYQKFSTILKYLCVFLLVYLVVPFLSKQNWPLIIRHSLVPDIQFNKEFLSILVAVLGTTISPYLFFWQATMEVEEMKHLKKHLMVNKTLIHNMKIDVFIGMLFSNIVMFFIILTTGTVLFNGGIHQIETVEQAAKFFENVPTIARKLDTLVDVGLGYIRLGQPATTFSGGEAQRIKLASELSRRSTGRTMYILDEPTTGLHSADVKRLLGILQKLVEGGNSMVIIEHNLDVIKTADHVIDMGPEGGNGGGQVIAEGTPEQIAKITESFTGKYLKQLL